MTPAKVKFGTEEKFVLFFSGGYDTNQDSNTIRQDDTVGNAIYMVDASNGDLLWWASNLAADLNIPTMTNSIPASISAVDITGDGFINYLFAADTGGRVFRIDINQTNAGKPNFASGGAIASLAGTDAVNNRRFYNKPNVALVKDKQFGDHLTISIGSGYRAHPILTTDVQNRFYMIKDLNPYEAPATYIIKGEAPLDLVTLGEDEIANPRLLYNASSIMLEGETALTPDMQIIMSTGGGWYVEMKTKGEKVLSESTTFSGAVIFTSFAPSLGGGRCGADTGTSRTYALSQRNAMANVDLNGDGETNSDDASKVLAHSGIAPRPVVIYRKGGGKSIAIGTETIDDNRFKSSAAAPCVALGTCEAVAVPASKCDSNNCYVIPIYWRQNTNNN
jgi:type IV pilus assembly protein PilY1